MEHWEDSTNMLLDRYPDLRDMLRKHEKEGTMEDKEYKDGMMKFYSMHVCRNHPWPEDLSIANKQMEEDPVVYNVMWVVQMYILP